jgi:hypothetical protein
LSEPQIAEDYLLPALFAAQYAFNLAANFALVARLIVFFLAFEGAPVRAAGLARRKFAHLAFCAAAIFFFTEALMVRFFVDAGPDLVDTPRMLPSSLLSFSICSLIAAARLSWLTVRSYISMRQVSIQKAGENQGINAGTCRRRRNPPS